MITNDLCEDYYGSTITENLVCAGDYMDGDGNDFDDEDACQVGRNKQIETFFKQVFFLRKHCYHSLCFIANEVIDSFAKINMKYLSLSIINEYQVDRKRCRKNSYGS